MSRRRTLAVVENRTEWARANVLCFGYCAVLHLTFCVERLLAFPARLRDQGGGMADGAPRTQLQRPSSRRTHRRRPTP